MPCSTKKTTKSRTVKSKTNTKKYAPRVKDYQFDPYYITYVKPTLRDTPSHPIGEGETYLMSIESAREGNEDRPYYYLNKNNLSTGRLTAHKNSKIHKEWITDLKRYARNRNNPSRAEDIMALKQVKAARKSNKRKSYTKVKKYAAYDKLNPLSRRYSKVPDWVYY